MSIKKFIRDRLKDVGLLAGKALTAVTMFSVFFSAIPTHAAMTTWLVPSGDSISPQGWISSTGAANWTNVNDGTCNGLTDYNSSYFYLRYDWYTISLASIPNGSTVNKIEIIPCLASQSAVTSTAIRVAWRWNGGSPNPSGYNDYTYISGTTPIERATTTWTGLSISKNSASTLELGAASLWSTSTWAGSVASKFRIRITY